jgi:hypothetical protein
MNPIPSIPMLSGNGGNGKVLMVLGIIAALLVMANQAKAAAPVKTS